VGGVPLYTGELGSVKSVDADLSNPDVCHRILAIYKPNVIIHLASQPSAPYSELTSQTRHSTQQNNSDLLTNLIYSAHELNLDPAMVVTTTTGIPGSPRSAILEESMSNLAGSSYHVSRGFDSANLALAARQWNMRILEMRTAIVYGLHVFDYDYVTTRFDWDYFFGTVIHRFLLLALKDVKIEIYGKGEQYKPLIALRDVVESIVTSIATPIPEGHKIVNQVTECIQVKEMAQIVARSIGLDPKDAYTHIPNPRIENEDHRLVVENTEFLKILTAKNQYSTSSLPSEMKHLAVAVRQRLFLLPNNWRDIFDGFNS